MAYGEISEFPHAHLGDDERGHHEFILLYKELLEKYSGTLNNIKELSEELAVFKSDMTRFVGTELEKYKQKTSSELEAQVEKYENDTTKVLDTKMSEITKVLDTKMSEITQSVASLENEMEEFGDKICDELYSIKDHHETFVHAMSLQYKDDIRVFNNTISNFKRCVNRKIKDLQNTLPLDIDLLKWLWDYAIGNGFTAIEWYMFSDVTCEQWNASGITCIEWYTKGKEVFNWYDRFLKLISPISGDTVSVQEAIIELVLSLKVNAITAGEYDKQQFTAQEIDGILGSVGDYDWAGDIYYRKSSTVEQKEGD